jgi:hypothetical protein
MAYVGSLKKKSTEQEINVALKRAVRALKGSSVPIKKMTVAKRAVTYLSAIGTSALEKRLDAMDERALKELGFPDEATRPECVVSGVKLLPSHHWRARKQTRPPSSF